MGSLRIFCNVITVSLFALTAVPLITLSPAIWSDPIEKRSSTALPELPEKLSMKTITAFQRGFEAFFNDHFGHRKDMIDIRSQIDFALFNRSPNPLVLIGKDDWLFYAEDKSVEDFKGQQKISDADLKVWAERLTQRHDWLAARGIPYYFVIAPNKQSIYPEKMPAYLRQGSSTQLDQLMAYLASQGKSYDYVLDYRADLVARKSVSPLYHSIDLHWNPYGAYFEYDRIMDRFVKQDHLPGFKRLSLTDNDFARVDMTSGDMSGMMGFKTYPHKTYTMRYAGSDLPCAKTSSAPVPAGVDTSLWKVSSDLVTECPGEGRTARFLMLRDSMGEAMLPYFASSAAHSRFVWFIPAFEDIKRYVEVEKPSVVIEERNERLILGPIR
jgi:hypothetical protein